MLFLCTRGHVLSPPRVQDGALLATHCKRLQIRPIHVRYAVGWLVGRQTLAVELSGRKQALSFLPRHVGHPLPITRPVGPCPVDHVSNRSLFLIGWVV